MFAPPRSTHCRITPAHILPRHSAASPSRCAASASSSRRRATATSARSARASRRCTRRAERARQQGSWRRGSASTVRPMPGVSLRLCQMLASAGFCYSFLDTWGSVSLSIPPSSLSLSVPLSLCPSLFFPPVLSPLILVPGERVRTSLPAPSKPPDRRYAPSSPPLPPIKTGRNTTIAQGKSHPPHEVCVRHSSSTVLV